MRQILKTSSSIAALVGAVAAVLLLLTLFMSWGQVVCAREPCPYPTGWHTLRVLDIPIALLAIGAVVAAVLSLFGRTATVGLVLAVIGGVAVALVLAAPLVERHDTPLFDFGGGWTVGLVTALIVFGSGVMVWGLSSGAFETEDV